jgi:hypothetical protein
LTNQVCFGIISLMLATFLPPKALRALLDDTIQRDRTTARRACLLKIMWQERNLTRSQLIIRVEGELGADCFGDLAWRDTFYRDMRVVKRAFRSAGYQLVYRRNLERPGYELLDQPPIGPDLAKILDGSVAEVDRAQLAVFRRLSISERFRLGCSVSDAARTAVAHRICTRNPHLSWAQANRLALSANQ